MLKYVVPVLFIILIAACVSQQTQGEKASLLEIVLSKDKYSTGEKIDVYIKNNGNETLFYASEPVEETDSSCNPLIRVEDLTANTNPTKTNPAVLVDIHPPVLDCVFSAPINNIQIVPREMKFVGTWDQRDYSSCDGKLGCKGVSVQPGNYRIIFDKVLGKEIEAAKEIEIVSQQQDLELPLPQPPATGVKEFKVTIGHTFYNPNTFTVNKGDTVKFLTNAAQGTGAESGFSHNHGITIDEYGINQAVTVEDVNNPVVIEFVADKSGTFNIYCKTCLDGPFGSGHPPINAKLFVVG